MSQSAPLTIGESKSCSDLCL